MVYFHDHLYILKGQLNIVVSRDLADTSQRGSLTKNEFVIVSFLVEIAKEGRTLPSTLPSELVASVLSTDSGPADSPSGTSSLLDESVVGALI